jgi:hypothetical protein
MTEKIIDLSKYFKNHYDSWGRLYCVEYTGNPLELQNAIKELEQENTIKTVHKYSSALKEIEKLSENAYCLTNGTNKDMAEFAKTIITKVNEVLNDT